MLYIFCIKQSMVLSILHFTLQIYTFFLNNQKYLQFFFNYFLFTQRIIKIPQKPQLYLLNKIYHLIPSYKFIKIKITLQHTFHIFLYKPIIFTFINFIYNLTIFISNILITHIIKINNHTWNITPIFFY